MKALLDELTTFVGLLSPTGEILYINNTSTNATGFSLTDVEGKKFQNIDWWSYSDKEMSKIASDIKSCAAGKRTLREIKLNTKSNGEVWIEFSLHPILDETGKVIYLVPEGRNVDHFKKESFLIKKSLDIIQTFVGILNKDGTVCYVNDAPLQKANLTKEQVIANKFWNTGWFQNDSNLRHNIEKYCAQTAKGQIISTEVVALFENKKARVRLNMRPIFNRKGDVIRIVAEGQLICFES
ncbi:MAG: PAS domain-containing protein [Enterobacterales bacterium]|nr:PAS domain-containing protein [Enterobacterales bacterium]